MTRLSALAAEFRYPDEEGRPRILAFNCPCGCMLPIEVVLQPKNPLGWETNGGTLETLTLYPSIAFYAGPEMHWHGYVRNGACIDVSES